MSYWYEVGVHPNPTEDDLPLAAEWSDRTITTHQANVPPSRTVLGVYLRRWCPLPTETAPPPEEECVEVEGGFYKVGSGPMGAGIDYVYTRPRGEKRWAQMHNVSTIARYAKVAIALGLVDPPVPADVQRVVDAAVRWRRTWHHEDSPNDKVRDVIAAVDALDSPAPVPADTSDPEPEPTGRQYHARPWEAGGTTWQWVVAYPNGAPMARCEHGAEAQAIAAALNASPSWPAMRPMSELADGRHGEPVLVGYDNGTFVVLLESFRYSDEVRGRVGWWPLPTVEEEGT